MILKKAGKIKIKLILFFIFIILGLSVVCPANASATINFRLAILPAPELPDLKLEQVIEIKDKTSNFEKVGKMMKIDNTKSNAAIAKYNTNNTTGIYLQPIFLNRKKIYKVSIISFEKSFNYLQLYLLSSSLSR